MKVWFYPEKRRTSDGRLIAEQCPLLMRVSVGGQRITLGTGVKIDLGQWDEKVQKFAATHPESGSMNGWLVSMEKTAGDVWRMIREEDADHPTVWTSRFKKIFQSLRPDPSPDLTGAFLQFLEEGSQQWSRASYMKARTFFRVLQGFEKQSGQRLQFHDMDAGFLDSFQVYLKGEGKADSTIRSSVNLLVWFLNWAGKKGFHSQSEYKGFYARLPVSPEIRRTQVFLTFQELQSFLPYPAASPAEGRVRDMFCFLCYTGLRFSELQRLKKPDIDPDRAEVHVTGKHTRTLPLNAYAAEIVQRYENKYYAKDAAFPVMSLVTFNKHLKNLGKALGFDRMVADREGREAPLFAQLAAGTAINTFIANAIRLGVSGEVIRYYTGVAEKKRLESIRESLMEEARDRFDRHKAISPGDREDIR